MNKTPGIEDLQKWRQETVGEIEELKSDISISQKKLLESQERLNLIEKLLDLEGEDMTITQNTKHTQNDFLDEIEKAIREMDKPLHIKTIHKMLLEKGVPIPGKGNEANVIARIQRSEGRIIRTGRGTYGLPDFNVDEVKPVKRLRKSTRRNK